jgi:LacI family transcriptional regulator
LSKRTTINDIARELGLTSASVSRALNDHPRISVDTKKSVQAKALEMNYRQNKLASSLRSGKSHTIGVIIPSAQINFFGSVVHGIQNMASVNGYTIILYQSEENQALEQKAIETFLDARVDGILVSISKETTDYSHFVELKKKKIPLVFLTVITNR